jgi:endonuclease/exonuclease/phosphatase family metal-dependent hydrolase
MDGRLRPDRIARVLEHLNADAYALQEVFEEQAQWLADKLGLRVAFGCSRILGGQPYGNAILSKVEGLQSSCCDISIRGREPRSCLTVDIPVEGGKVVRLSNVHMGTGYFERKEQVSLLVDRALQPEPKVARLLIGDFNEWIPGMASRVLRAQLETVDVRLHLRYPQSYPGLFPILHLDHVYHDRQLCLVQFAIFRTALSLVASDHLPISATFRWA